MLLVALAVSTGSVDAISWLGLGKVFSAFMTGNIVFLGLRAGAAPGPSVPRVLAALVPFAFGATLAARLVRRTQNDREVWPRNVTRALAATLVAQAAFAILWATVGGHPSPRGGDLLLAVSALAMGMQATAIFSLGVRALFTTAGTATFAVFMGDLSGWSQSRGERGRLFTASRSQRPRSLRRPRHSRPPTTTFRRQGGTVATLKRPNPNGDAPEPIVGDRGASILGPRNIPIELENPDLLISPDTDAGTVPNLKFSFATARNRVLTGGWAREVTVRELPIATEIAGVDMRLKPGGIRELHWHKEAEWAYMIAGSARISLLDDQGRLFVDDVGVGDLWYFPSGFPHSIQGLEDGCEFLLVFDSGDFSENETFLITDWFNHTPLEVLAKNFDVPESAFANLPTDIGHTRYMFAGELPAAEADDAPPYPAVEPPFSYTWHMLAQEPIKVPGGEVRITDSRNFSVAKRIAAARLDIEPGGIRELHWHPTTDEWQYYLSGRGRVTVFASGGKARTFDYQAGDVGYVPFAMGHYIENTGDEPLVVLEMFRSDHFADVSLSQWMGVLPPELVNAHLNLDDAVIAKLPKTKPLITR
jgi:oxalate decarboxylase